MKNRISFRYNVAIDIDLNMAEKVKTMQQVKQILVATDMSAMAEEALRRAISLAGEKKAQLIVIHVIEPLFLQLPFAQAVDAGKIRQQLTETIDRFNAQAQVEYVVFIESGKAAERVILQAQKTQADLIVVGSHGKEDIKSNYFGSTTLKLIQKTHVPVLVVKNSVDGAYRNMLVPTNLSNAAKESLLFANDLFTTPHRKYLYAFETISNVQAKAYRLDAEEAEQLRQSKTAEAAKAFKQFVKEVGDGGMELIEYSASINEDLLDYIKKDNADLLVLGSKGVGNLNSFVFGSTASYLLQRVPVDVLVYVPPVV